MWRGVSHFRSIDSKGRACGLIRFLLATLFIRLTLTWMLPTAPLNPDYAEYRRLATELGRHGQFGFGSDWRSDPELVRSRWRFLYQEHGATARPPGYPFVLAGALQFSGHDFRLHQLLHVSAESVNAVLIWYLAGALAGPAAAWGAWGLWLTCPRGYLYSMQMIREPFIVLFVLLWFVMLVRVHGGRPLRNAAGAGVCLGLGMYFKETLILLAIPSVIWLAWLMYRSREARRGYAAGACVLLACAAAVPLPWMVRNSLWHGRPTGFSTLGWFNVQEGLLPRGWIESLPAPVQARLDVTQASDPAAADRIYRDRAVTYLRAEPLGAVQSMVTNGLLFVSPASRDVIRWRVFDVKDVISITYTLCCYALMIVGIAAYQQRVEIRLILVTFVVMWASHAAFVGCPRFRYPFDSLLTVMAGAGVAVLISRRWGASVRRPIRLARVKLMRLRRWLALPDGPQPATSA